MARIYTKIASGGLWKRRTGADRDALVPGTYKPNASNTGALNTVLPAYNQNGTNTIIITQDNTVLQNLEIFGDIHVQAKNVVIKNCILRGGNFIPTSNSGVINANSAKCFNLTVEDCTIDPIKPSYYRDGIVGHEYTLRRCNIMHTNDGAGAFITSSIGTVCNVNIEACYIHDLTYWYPDPAHTDGTHNDCIQIQGGANIHVIGNTLHGTAVLGAGSGMNPDEPGLFTNYEPNMSNGSVIIIQNNTTPLVNVVVEKNWLDYGKGGLNMKPGSYTFRDNKFGRHWFNYNWDNPGFQVSEYPIRGDDSTVTNVTGLYDSNRWEDDNTLMAGAINGGDRFDGIRWNNIPD